MMMFEIVYKVTVSLLWLQLDDPPRRTEGSGVEKGTDVLLQRLVLNLVNILVAQGQSNF